MRLPPGLTFALGALLAPALAAGPQPAPSPPAPEEEPVLGTPSGFAAAEEERLEVAAGLRLRERPDLQAPILVRVDAASELPVLERRGKWVRLRYGVYRGWARLDGEEGPLTAARAGSAGQGTDPARLARARALLAAGREISLGPYRLLTDLDDARLLARLDVLAGSVRQVYRERLGLEPPPPAGEVVVLFGREADYRRFSAGEETLEGLEAHGHAGGGMAALAAEDKEPEALAALLVHELVHLENRRAFPGELPPWLEEGLAEDLAYSRLDAGGRLQPGTLGGHAIQRRDRLGNLEQMELAGARAALSRLLQGWDDRRRRPLEELLSLSWYELVEPSVRPILYPQSAFFVRFLLDGGDPGLAAGFRAYLAQVAAGGPAGGATLAAHLERSWREVEAAYLAWLRRQASQHLPAP